MPIILFRLLALALSACAMAVPAPAEVVENILIASPGAAAVRAGESRLLTFRGNRGSGRIEGASIKLESVTQQTAVPDLPELPNHPAWRFLDRDEVAGRFQLDR